jgi:dCTP deaminase
LLNREQLTKYVADGTLKLDGFDPKNLNPASYDAGLGRRAFLSSSNTKLNVEAKGIMTLEPGDFAVVTTFEKFVFPLNIAGTIGIRSHYARKGIIQLSGPQIDPGFRGVLVIGLFNASPRSVVIPFKEPFLTISFFQLVEPAKEGYQGEYQDQEDVPTADIEWLAETRGMSFGQIITTLQTLNSSVAGLDKSVEDLDKSIGRMQWIVGIALTAIAAIVAVAALLRI